MNKQKWHSWLKALPLLLVILLVMNPEIRAFAFFIDFIGLDLMVLLLALQMRVSTDYLVSYLVNPAYQALCYFSVRPCFMPTLETARKMPTLLIHALPVMPLFIVSMAVLFVGKTYFGLPI